MISKPTWRFDPNASYLIAGGLGGIGRAISRWMMGKGVKHLILPSRFGAESPAALELMKDLEEGGVQVFAPTCDVSSQESFSAVLTESARTMPPIKGCINAAMVLQVSPRPTHGSISLHPLIQFAGLHI
jgi:NAD(P)-dependent dehydrogenase (short-subunit alcohol dehydrogenase family)